jgi:peptidoglycan-N-acetylglucosamine deacetylase
VAITFDDGPDPVWTPKLLDLLGRIGARATFFPIAPHAAANPELIERMRANGHAVGLHCDEHVRHRERDLTWLRNDTATAIRRLARLGLKLELWRTPWGELAPWTIEVARDHDLRIVGWTVDTHDWRGDRAADMFAATRESIAEGTIILAHDGLGPGCRRDGAEQTLVYVELIAAYVRERGLELEALT